MIIKKLLFAVIAILTTSMTFAQTEINGIVKDATGVPIIGANIIIAGTNIGTTTDFDGNFKLSTSLTGDQTLRISYVGFTPHTESVSLTGTPITLNITLQEGGNQLDEIVLSATTTFRSQKQAPLSISSLKAKEITRLTPNSQADIIRAVPGITAEGGGGEVATNVFVRGLPSPGQFGFTPLQHDGMPLIASFGLNSSAHDVYGRNDLGFKGVEFVRGGAASLYGAGSLAGLINYISKTGDTDPGTTIQVEWADQGRIKTDFYHGGQLGSDDSNSFYTISGYVRKDDGPYDTGLTSRGSQFRGTFKQKFDKGSFIFYGQYIDDKVHFFLPLPLDANQELINGNDGNTVEMLLPGDLSGTSFRTIGGNYESPYGDGVATKGGYAMAELDYNLTDNLNFESRIRYASYQHSFALYVNGNGANPNPISLDDYVEGLYPGNQGYSATFQGGVGQIPGNTLVLDNLHIDRIRPMQDYSAEAALTFKTNDGHHNFKLGTYLSRTEVVDDNYQFRALTEFNNNAQLINLSVTDAGGNNVIFSQGGIYNRIGQTANQFLSQNRTAFYLTDEMIFDRWRFDVGIRWEETNGEFLRGNIVSTQVYDDPDLTPELANVQFEDGTFIRGFLSDSDLAISLAGLYELTNTTNLYANFSRGYFFPQFRSFAPSAGNRNPFYQAQNLTQFEFGAKFGNKTFSGSLAAYTSKLDNVISVQRQVINDVLVDTQRNETSARTLGVEATWDWAFVKNLHLIGSFTYQDHEITKGTTEDLVNGGVTSANEGNEINRIPNILASAGLFFDDGGFDANFGINHTGDKFDDLQNTRPLPDITIARLGAGYTFDTEGDFSLRLGANIFNLFNTRGVTESNPRSPAAGADPNFTFGRPVLPRRFFITATFDF